MKCVRTSRLSLPRRPWGIALSLATVSLTIASPACRQPDAGPASASQSAPVVRVALATPEEAARSVLTCLHAQWAARQRYDQAAAERCREQLRAMAADNVIRSRHRGVVRRPSQIPDELLDTFVQGWAPIIGFYADGLQLDRIQEVPHLPAEQDQVFVRVPAVSSRGEAIIRLECCRGPDRRWRVARIDFEPTASLPSPTTAPSP